MKKVAAFIFILGIAFSLFAKTEIRVQNWTNNPVDGRYMLLITDTGEKELNGFTTPIYRVVTLIDKSNYGYPVMMVSLYQNNSKDLIVLNYDHSVTVTMKNKKGDSISFTAGVSSKSFSFGAHIEQGTDIAKVIEFLQKSGSISVNVVGDRSKTTYRYTLDYFVSDFINTLKSI